MELQAEPISPEIHLPMLRNWGEGTWRTQAACRGQDTSLFFTEKEDLSGLTPLQKQRRQAKKDFTDPNLPGNMISRARLLCVKCPVRKECLKFAIENGIVHGMYGGQPPRERRGMTINNLDERIPIKSLLTDLNRIRRVEKRDRTTPLAYDLGLILDVPTSRAEKMLRNNELPEFV